MYTKKPKTNFNNDIIFQKSYSLKTKQPDKHFSNDLSELLSTKADEFLICRTNLIRSKIFAKKEQIDNVSYDLEDVSDLELNSDNDV